MGAFKLATELRRILTLGPSPFQNNLRPEAPHGWPDAAEALFKRTNLGHYLCTSYPDSHTVSGEGGLLDVPR